MIRGIHYFSTELKTKIDVIPRSCFKPTSVRYLVLAGQLDDLHSAERHLQIPRSRAVYIHHLYASFGFT